MSKLKKVVIVGGGFAGLKALNRISDYSYKFEITLVDKNDYAILKPKLTSIVAAVDVEDIKVSIPPILREYQAAWQEGEVESIDTKTQKLTLKNSDSLSYDYLILANGVEPDYLGFDKNNFYSFATYKDAINLEQAISAFDGGDINIVVAKNPINENSAIEAAFLIKEHLNDLKIDGNIKLIFSDTLCPNIGNKSREVLEDELKSKNIEVVYNANIKAIEKDSILLEDGAINSNLTIVVPSFKVPEFIANSDIKTDKNGIVTNEKLVAKGFENILAVGDINALSNPKLAHNAFKQADIAIDYIINKEQIEKTDSIYKPDTLAVIEVDKLNAILIYSNKEENIDFTWKSLAAKELKVIFKNALLFSLGELPSKLDEGIKKLIVKYQK